MRKGIHHGKQVFTVTVGIDPENAYFKMKPDKALEEYQLIL
ncbi:MAG: hypothetical protein OEY51_04055 [Cyclobacteriaceae bacterium]|nr:hypothetical protein [Cyclobacteriaceae bacterium]